jgi:hypothetical protein
MPGVAACRWECRSFLAQSLLGALAYLREAACVAVSAALAVACLLTMAWPLILRAASLVAASVSRWAWDFLAQAAWGRLAAQLPTPALSLLPTPEANATLAAVVPALLLEAGTPAGAVQAVGAAWTWACLALATWRRLRSGR